MSERISKPRQARKAREATPAPARAPLAVLQTSLGNQTLKALAGQPLGGTLLAAMAPAIGNQAIQRLVISARPAPTRSAGP